MGSDKLTRKFTPEEIARAEAIAAANPLPPKTITIPVAEYEGLKRRAKVYEALTPEDWKELRIVLSLGASYEPDRSWRSRAYRAITAAIKEQEG